jgi:copper chaperone CopZ
MKKSIFALILFVSLGACTTKQAPKAEAQPIMVEAKLHVEGMHCDDCEASIAKGVNGLAGIDSISANHEDSTAFVRFDSNKTNLKNISKAIEGRGYIVASK